MDKRLPNLPENILIHIALRRTSSLYVILLLFFIVLFYFFITKRAMSSLSDKPRQIIFIGGYPRSGE
ncbi:hypothetical protein EWB00_001156 [Schistosoma japonicum]|uniref:Uncharacterized protein n=2 Tax=Schistosoma japonicum TaxID=6182 RepID=A0A4Z2DHF4_SCHJA|nr:hypothetical protein EWB00_001156 [Schistosoma japonicum]